MSSFKKKMNCLYRPMLLLEFRQRFFRLHIINLIFEKRNNIKIRILELGPIRGQKTGEFYKCMLLDIRVMTRKQYFNRNYEYANTMDIVIIIFVSRCKNDKKN